MCVVTWAEDATAGPNSYIPTQGTVTIRHISEVLLYDFHNRTVQITLIVVPHVETSNAVYIHCAHRRAVMFRDVTASLMDESSFDGKLVRALGLIDEAYTVESSTPSEGLCVAVHVEKNSTKTAALLPKRVGFEIDRYYIERDGNKGELPFTSACFGPIAPRRTPYALGLSVTIRGEAFDQLIAIFRSRISRYLYSIEGPDIVRRDIAPLDLLGSHENIREVHHKVLRDGLHKRRLNVKSYDIFTLDAPSEYSDYVRLISMVEQTRCERPLQLGDRDYLVNSWHSEQGDFLIQRVSFCPD